MNGSTQSEPPDVEVCLGVICYRIALSRGYADVCGSNRTVLQETARSTTIREVMRMAVTLLRGPLRCGETVGLMSTRPSKVPSPDLRRLGPSIVS